MNEIHVNPTDAACNRASSGFAQFWRAYNRTAIVRGQIPVIYHASEDNRSEIDGLRRRFDSGATVEAILNRPDVSKLSFATYCERYGSPDSLYAAEGGWFKCDIRKFHGYMPAIEVNDGENSYCRQLSDRPEREADLAAEFAQSYTDFQGHAGPVLCLGHIYRQASEITEERPSSKFPFNFSEATRHQPAGVQFPKGVFRTFVIPEGAVDAMEAAVRRLTRVARKIGLEPEPTLKVEKSSRREMQKLHETILMDGSEVMSRTIRTEAVPVVDCVLTLPGMGFQVPGAWRVVGVIQPIVREDQKGHENEIFTRNEADRLKAEEYRNHGPNCEHCRKQRERTRTLLIEATDGGKLMQVGVDCAVLYVGDRVHKEVGSLEFNSFLCEVLRPYEEGWDGEELAKLGGAALLAWDTEEVVTNAVASVRTYGWESSKQKEFPYDPNPLATGKMVQAKLTNRWGQTFGGNGPPPYEITADDTQKAQEVMSWLDAQKPDRATDEYLANLKEMFEPGWISEKRLRFAVSVVRAHSRALEQKERDAAAKVSQFVGAIDERRQFTLTLKGFSEFQGFGGGTSRAYRLQDEAGNMFAWLTGGFGGITDDMVGKTLRLAATIAKHEEYRGANVTRLARVKVIGEEAAVAVQDAAVAAVPKPKRTRKAKAPADAGAPGEMPPVMQTETPPAVGRPVR